MLTLNGLSWKSMIFPGQVLKLKKSSAPKASAPAPKSPAESPSLGSASYTVRSGDTISGIAARHGIGTQKLLDVNGLTWSSVIYPGQKIKIPGGSGDSTSLELEKIANSTPGTPYYHIVKSGDTISGIAAKYGVSTQKVLDANGLRLSSIIYPGQKIKIPGKSGDSSTVELNAEQTRNARIIIEVGRSLGVPDRGIVVALAAAMQESSPVSYTHLTLPTKRIV